MLDTADNLLRAADAVPEQFRELAAAAEEGGEEGGDDSELAKSMVALYKGVGTIDAALHTSLARFGVTKFADPVGLKVRTAGG